MTWDNIVIEIVGIHSNGTPCRFHIVPARMAMIAMTMRSSINVSAVFFIVHFPFLEVDYLVAEFFLFFRFIF